MYYRTNTPYDFGKKIKEIRISKHMSLKYVEQLSDVSASYLNKLESGQNRSPSLPIFIALAEAYSMEVMDLLKIALNDYGIINL